MTKMEVSNSTEQTTLIVTLINGPSFQTLIRLFSKRDVGKLNCTMVWELPSGKLILSIWKIVLQGLESSGGKTSKRGDCGTC